MQPVCAHFSPRVPVKQGTLVAFMIQTNFNIYEAFFCFFLIRIVYLAGFNQYLYNWHPKSSPFKRHMQPVCAHFSPRVPVKQGTLVAFMIQTHFNIYEAFFCFFFNKNSLFFAIFDKNGIPYEPQPGHPSMR